MTVGDAKDAGGGGWPPHLGHVRLDEIDSTNAEAMRLAVAGHRGPLWITATRQTAGRGRSGRSWMSEAGNLYASLLLAPRCEASALQHLAFIAGVAVHDAVSDSVGGAALGARLRLKWPNDLLLDGAKIGGILVESSRLAGETVAVIGIGLNLVHHPRIEGYASSSLADAGFHVDRIVQAGLLVRRIDQWLGIWHEGQDFEAIRTAWMARGPVVGSQLTVNGAGAGAGQRLDGRFAGLDRDGALLLRFGAGDPPRRFTWGDVTEGWAAEAASDPSDERGRDAAGDGTDRI